MKKLIILFLQFCLSITQVYCQWTRDTDFIEGRKLIVNSIGDNFSLQIPNVDFVLLERNKQQYEWAINEIKKSIAILEQEQKLPALIVISDKMTKKQKEQAVKQNEKVENIRNQYYSIKMDALVRLGIPELKKYLANYNDKIIEVVKRNFGLACRQCVTVLGELNLPSNIVDSVRKSPNASQAMKAKLGDKDAEALLIKSFEQQVSDSLGWEWKKIQSIASELLYINNTNSRDAFFKALQSGRVLKRFFKDNYERDKSENIQIETPYPLDENQRQILLKDYSTEYVSLAAILITSYADYDPDPLVYFRKWINTSNSGLNGLTKERITYFFYKTTGQYLSTKFHSKVEINVDFSRKGFLTPNQGMRLFYVVQ